MKEFTTLTEVEILNAAYHTLLARWLKEQERYEADPNKHTKAWADKARAKLDELHDEIVRLENQ